MGAPATPPATPPSTDPVQQFITQANAKIAAVYNEGLIVVKEIETEAVAALGIVDEDLPAILGVVNGIATLTAVFLPGAAIAPFIADAAAIVAKVDEYVVTADGIVADPSVAITVAGAANDMQKQAAAVAQLTDLHPTVPKSVATAHVALAVANMRATAAANAAQPAAS